MEELKPCPFCGGEARLTGKDCEYVGENGVGDKKIKYKIRAICNKCHSMGKPIKTDGFISREHNFWLYQRGYRGDMFFDKYAQEAIEAWNRRTT